MPPQFLGNPFEPNEWGDSDFEINADEEWITLPNDIIIMENRAAQNFGVDAIESDGDHFSDDTDWLVNSDDDYNDDYNLDEVDDETEYIDELNEMLLSDNAVSSSFYGLYETNVNDFNDDDDLDFDYVTYPLNDNTAVTDENPKTESNSNNLTTQETDTD